MICEIKNGIIHQEKSKMIVMDVKINNFISFNNFHMNMSYPKKIVNSFISNEFLKERTNFRYKKINVIMGANASGKTSIGRMLMAIFNFMDKKQYEKITETICDTSKEASFSIDFVTEDYTLYRVQTIINPKTNEQYQVGDINVVVKSIEIGNKDSYETCIEKIEKLQDSRCSNYIEELEKIDGLSWVFAYPIDSSTQIGNVYKGNNYKKYIQVLSNILKTLDPAIIKVDKINEIKNTYVIRYVDNSVIVQDGKLIDHNILSSGTKAGIDIANMLIAIIEGTYGFYYCDEKFSYIHSDVEKAILSVMINEIHEDEQLFFTTHNTNILDLPLPKHTFTFLKKDVNNTSEPIKCISASELLKRNTDSLKNAVENDLFSVAPNIDLIYNLVND